MSIVKDITEIENELSTIAVKCESIMPLFSSTIKLSVQILGVYKESFKQQNQKVIKDATKRKTKK